MQIGCQRMRVMLIRRQKERQMQGRRRVPCVHGRVSGSCLPACHTEQRTREKGWTNESVEMARCKEEDGTYETGTNDTDDGLVLVERLGRILCPSCGEETHAVQNKCCPSSRRFEQLQPTLNFSRPSCRMPAYVSPRCFMLYIIVRQCSLIRF